MPKKIVAAGGGILAVALLGIGGWKLVHDRAVAAQDAAGQQRFEQRSQLVDVTFTVTAPANTPAQQLLYLSGDVPALGAWDAAGVPLERSGDGKYSGVVKGLQNTGEYKFKVTRGTWGTVETTQEGRPIDDRVFTAAKDAKVDAKVEDWNDHGQATPGKVTMTGNVVVHKNALASKILNNARTLVVYLPPDYEKNKDARYPVLYMQDGQNLFDEATSYQGIEWKLDEAAQGLIASGRMKPAIIVGVFNSEQRTPEFTPPFASGSIKGAPKGDAYARMLVEEAKPFIDKTYRTQAGRENTFIGGGSMGAMIALYTAAQHGDVFGGVVALSPWLRVGEKGEKVLVPDLIGDGAWLKKTRLYMDMGTDAGHNYPGGADHAVPDAEAFVAAATDKAGVSEGEQFAYREIEGGTHNESAWQATAEQMLLAVFGVPQPAATSPSTAPATQNAATDAR